MLDCMLITPCSTTPTPSSSTRQRPETIGDIFNESNRFLSNLKELPTDRHERLGVHLAAAAHGLNWLKIHDEKLASEPASSGQRADEKRRYQLLMMKCLKTALMTGDTTWESFRVAAMCFQALEDVPNRPGLELTSDGLTEHKLDCASLYEAWITCQYNFIHDITYEITTPPEAPIEKGYPLHEIHEECRVLYEALSSSDFPENLPRSIAANEFAFQVLRSMKPHWSGSVFEEDDLVRHVHALHDCYEDAPGNPRLAQDLAAVTAGTAIRIPQDTTEPA